MPVATPTDVRGEGYNGTANLATWKQIPATREAARGIVLGYQVRFHPRLLLGSYRIHVYELNQDFICPFILSIHDPT